MKKELNVAKGNMYGFITHTWNPIKGHCYHQCSYCYMNNSSVQLLLHEQFVDSEVPVFPCPR